MITAYFDDDDLDEVTFEDVLRDIEYYQSKWFDEAPMILPVPNRGCPE
jgi:hypothetical protein